MAESKLTNEQRTFATQSLACWDSPSVVAEALRLEYGVKITPQSIEFYDPTKRAGRNCAAKWRALFEETRKAFLEDTSKIGTSHRAVRLRALERMFIRAESMGNLPLAASLLEQIAKETGGALTNRREHTGANGAPLQAIAPTIIFKLPDNGR